MSGKPDNTATVQPVRFYTEEELDEMEKTDPLQAARIARAQAMAARLMARRKAPDLTVMPDPKAVAEALQSVRQILNRDGGDIELVAIDDHVVRVRMKGACVGCPNAVLDMQNLVERIVGGVPGVAEVRNTF